MGTTVLPSFRVVGIKMIYSTYDRLSRLNGSQSVSLDVSTLLCHPPTSSPSPPTMIPSCSSPSGFPLSPSSLFNLHLAPYGILLGPFDPVFCPNDGLRPSILGAR